jgi:hypothetical protein
MKGRKVTGAENQSQHARGTDLQYIMVPANLEFLVQEIGFHPNSISS